MEVLHEGHFGSQVIVWGRIKKRRDTQRRRGAREGWAKLGSQGEARSDILFRVCCWILSDWRIGKQVGGWV